MNTNASNNEPKPEDDLKILQTGKSRDDGQLTNEIQLDVDVAKIFPDSKSVNEALRFLIRITKEHITELTHR